MSTNPLNKTFWLGLFGSLILVSNSHANSFSMCELTDQEVDVLLDEAAEASTRVMVGSRAVIKDLVNEICDASQEEEDLASLLVKIEGMSERKNLPGKKVLSTSPLAMLLLIEILAVKKKDSAKQLSTQINS